MGADGGRVRGPVDPRLLRYATASRGFFVAIGAIALAQTAVIVAFAWLLTRAITDAIDGLPPSALAPTLGALAAVIAARALLLWVREVVAARAAAHVELQLRANLVAAVGRLGPEWLAAHNSARLAVTAGRGLEALDAYFGRYLPQLVQTVVATPLLLAVIWWHDAVSGLTVLFTLPLIPLFMVLIGLATRAVQQKQWQTLGHLAARFSDTVNGLSTLKVFGRHRRAVDTIGTVTDTYRRETMRVLRVSFLSGFALEFLASISVAIIAVTIGFRLIDGTLALFVGLFVLLLAPEAYLPLRQVGVQFHAAAEGVAATDDVFSVLDAARTVSSVQNTRMTDATEPRVLDTRRPGVLELRDVRVRRGERMLPGVSFTAAPGTVTLLQGASGAGKSSVFAALRGAARFNGAILLGGEPAPVDAPATWLAWAGQQPGLIAGTVAGNVSIGDDAPDDALLTRALTVACADGIAADLDLGVQGAGLSGGQAQRVAVARAVYRHLRGQAQVVALDEPSAALDAGTEAALWRGIRSLADAGATVLLISHRGSAERIADRVVTLTGVRDETAVTA
ncbi:thiol reductant ABC exporter subunit CydD [Microbacterium sp. bgisy189]|uniref:thiol reductant ABC exporter subunit CydD n=1 Tax=Microbacterium sp. bgisy189 TaxID=3413798 RepID=UPI003EBEB9A1